MPDDFGYNVQAGGKEVTTSGTAEKPAVLATVIEGIESLLSAAFAPPDSPVSSEDGPLLQLIGPANRQRRIGDIEPVEDSVTCRKPLIYVGVSLNTAMRAGGDGGPTPGALRLELDGKDITAQASLGNTEDHPPSRAWLEYVSKAPLSLGEHSAAVSLLDDGGKRQTNTWKFRVAAQPCRFDHGTASP